MCKQLFVVSETDAHAIAFYNLPLALIVGFVRTSELLIPGHHVWPNGRVRHGSREGRPNGSGSAGLRLGSAGLLLGNWSRSLPLIGTSELTTRH
jgi:hypothetical protein